MTDDATTGIALSRAYFEDIIDPILASRFPGMTSAAGRLGAGSDVLGLDDATSQDHDWGLRLSLFVPESQVAHVDAELERSLPDTFLGRPTRFAFTGQTESRHHIEVGTVAGFVGSRLGFDPRDASSVSDWLSLSGQAVLEVVAGPVFRDPSGDLESVRTALDWYPDDIWRYVLACDWIRIAQELPLMARAADVGDEIGSRIIASRLAHTTMHLAYLLERRWPPYAKWFGSLFQGLPIAGDVSPAIRIVLTGNDAESRQRGLAAALDALVGLQNALGLTDVARATIPFWDRPHLHPNPAIAAQLLDSIQDPDVRSLPRGQGSIEQRTDNVDVLVDVRARRKLIAG